MHLQLYIIAIVYAFYENTEMKDICLERNAFALYTCSNADTWSMFLDINVVVHHWPIN